MLFQGILSNHRSQPTVVDWFGVVFRSGKVREVRLVSDPAADNHLHRPVANPGRDLDKHPSAEAAAPLTPTVERAASHMANLCRQHMDTLKGR